MNKVSVGVRTEKVVAPKERFMRRRALYMGACALWIILSFSCTKQTPPSNGPNNLGASLKHVFSSEVKETYRVRCFESKREERTQSTSGRRFCLLQVGDYVVKHFGVYPECSFDSEGWTEMKTWPNVTFENYACGAEEELPALVKCYRGFGGVTCHIADDGFYLDDAVFDARPFVHEKSSSLMT